MQTYRQRQEIRTILGQMKPLGIVLQILIRDILS